MENQFSQFNQEPEINLIDYIRIVWRRKKQIFVIFIAFVIISIIVSLTTPKTYQSSALVTPAKISDQIVEDTGAVIDVLKQETVLRELAQKLDLPELQAFALTEKFKVTQNDGFWEIQGMGQTQEQAKKMVEVISSFIINRENTIATRFKPDLEAETVLLQDELEKNATNIADLEEKISASSKTISPAQGYIVASYISALQSAKLRRDGLQKEFYDKQQELNFKTQEARIDVPAVLSLKPISSNKKLNLVIGAILGLFFGIFYAFAAEYFTKNKDKI
jgi:uncharacterized protein involved in exopolysaccharide biosynthesis